MALPACSTFQTEREHPPKQTTMSHLYGWFKFKIRTFEVLNPSCCPSRSCRDQLDVVKVYRYSRFKYRMHFSPLQGPAGCRGGAPTSSGLQLHRHLCLCPPPAGRLGCVTINGAAFICVRSILHLASLQRPCTAYEILQQDAWRASFGWAGGASSRAAAFCGSDAHDVHRHKLVMTAHGATSLRLCKWCICDSTYSYSKCSYSKY